MNRHRAYRCRTVQSAINIEDLRRLAARHLANIAFEYLEGGAEEERTLRRNRQAFDQWQFIPRTLVNTESRHLRTSLFGRDYALPIIIAPTGNNGLQRRQGDLKLARAATQAQIPFCLSTVSNTRPEEITSRSGCDLWMQLYILEKPEITADLLTHAAAANAQALIVTTDANVFGNREWDQRNFKRPGQPNLRSVLDALCHLPWLWDVAFPTGFAEFVNIAAFLPPHMRSARHGATYLPTIFKARVDWDLLARLRERWPRTLIVKGILHPKDVERAIELGIDGVVLSNHGGRQLDGSVAPIEMLPEIAQAYRARITLLIDSGFRRGTDIAKALALGAHGVLLGRAPLYGLAAGGEAGVTRALTILTCELDRVLGQLGLNSVQELNPACLRAGWPTAFTEQGAR